MPDRTLRPSWARQLALTVVLALGVLSIVATGGDGDGGAQVNRGPVLSNLTLSPSSVAFMTGAGQTSVTATVTYTDPEADIVSLRVVVAGGSTTVIPISPPLPGSSGQLTGQVALPTNVAGDYTVEVWAVDAAANDSNHLTATLEVQGSAALSQLTLSAAALDPAFDPATTVYTARVPFTASSATVAATPLEPAATVRINGATVASGVESPPIGLEVGETAIAIDVTSSDGALNTSYAITVHRQANALLSDLSHSAGTFDQIFQPTLMAYTGTVSPLRTTTTVTAVLADPGATVVVEGTNVPSGEASAAIGLVEGANTVTITVTGVDQIATETYTIELARQPVAGLSEVARLTPSNSDEGSFGWSVALSGDTLVVGSDEGNVLGGGGAVYVFTRDGSGSWLPQAYLVASNTDPNDFFGASVAISGDTIAVGDYYEASAATGVNGDQDDDNAFESGAVYVFTRDQSGAWTQQAYIKASNTEAGDRFGYALALAGDTLAVGAPVESSNATSIDGDQANDGAFASGAVYVFTRDQGGLWSQQSYIKASNTGGSDQLGTSLALTNDTLVVGAPGEDSAATGIGGDQADNGAPAAGAAYVFARTEAGTWSQQAYVKASNTTAGDEFGFAVALADDTLAIGARFEASAATGVGGDQSDNTVNDAGAAYVFTRNAAGHWSQQAYIKASNTSGPG